MLFRMTVPQQPLGSLGRLGHIIDWYLSVRHPVRLARALEWRRSERRRRVRERRITMEEEHWLRLTSMSDSQVVGLERRTKPPV